MENIELVKKFERQENIANWGGLASGFMTMVMTILITVCLGVIAPILAALAFFGLATLAVSGTVTFIWLFKEDKLSRNKRIFYESFAKGYGIAFIALFVVGQIFNIINFFSP